MRIGFIEPHLKVFGGIRRIVEMANRLHDRGHDVTIYHSDGSPCTWLECRARIAPGRAVLDSEHDVIVYNDPEPEDMFLAHNARSLATFYYVLHLYRRELLAGFAGFHPALYMGRNKRTRRLRACLRSPHVKLANASWIQRWLSERMRTESELLIGGVNFELFHPVPVERAEGAPFRVLASGDPRPGKGTDTVIAAIDIVRAEVPGVELVTYHGKGIPQGQMAATYSSADVFADASRNSGGWNNPVAEAMACGVPVVCTVNGQVEDFAFDDRTALMSPPSDAAALAANIRRMMREPDTRARLSAAAFAHIRTFDWDASIERFEAIAARHVGAAR
jgi:glycosyltransferase involved in cell wall biosynthesis